MRRWSLGIPVSSMTVLKKKQIALYNNDEKQQKKKINKSILLLVNTNLFSQNFPSLYLSSLDKRFFFFYRGKNQWFSILKRTIERSRIESYLLFLHKHALSCYISLLFETIEAFPRFSGKKHAFPFCLHGSNVSHEQLRIEKWRVVSSVLQL